MALSSSSTLSDALAQYNDNLAYEGDPTKAQNIIEAIRWLTGNRPEKYSLDGQGREMNNLQAVMDDAKQYLSVDTSSSSSRRSTFTRGVMV